MNQLYEPSQKVFFLYRTSILWQRALWCCGVRSLPLFLFSFFHNKTKRNETNLPAGFVQIFHEFQIAPNLMGQGGNTFNESFEDRFSSAVGNHYVYIYNVYCALIDGYKRRITNRRSGFCVCVCVCLRVVVVVKSPIATELHKCGFFTFAAPLLFLLSNAARGYYIIASPLLHCCFTLLSI